MTDNTTTTTTTDTTNDNDDDNPPQADVMFIFMFGLTFLAALLTGSTLEWVYARGVLTKGWTNVRNQYNIIVLVASWFSGAEALCNFILYYYRPTQTWYLFLLLGQWMIMTHASVMVVSNRLSMLYRNAKQVWHRLLLINVFMLPVSILVFCTWGGDKISNSNVYANMNVIVEPVQIALWGGIEFCLSGTFIVKMWRYKWTTVERKAFGVLLLVAVCDVATVLANVWVGDLESTVVKAFAYCLRIRLEVNVLTLLVDFLEGKRRSATISGLPSSSGGGGSHNNNNHNENPAAAAVTSTLLAPSFFQKRRASGRFLMSTSFSRADENQKDESLLMMAAAAAAADVDEEQATALSLQNAEESPIVSAHASNNDLVPQPHSLVTHMEQPVVATIRTTKVVPT